MKRTQTFAMDFCAALTISVLFVSCGSSSFNGTSNKEGAKPEAPQAVGAIGLSTTCEFPATSDIKVKASAAAGQFVLKGNLCPTGPTVTQSLNHVIFVVDISGSTSTTDPSSGNSCGRLVAAQSLVSALKKQAGSDAMKLAVITFDGEAQLISGFISIATADAVINFNSMCSNGRSANGGTNYEAAFKMVQQQIATGSSGSLVFLMSDGMPNTSSGGSNWNSSSLSAKDAGLAAVNQCRTIDPAMLVEAVFLNGSAGSSSSSQDAFAYLTTITGAANRVAMVSNAQDLAAAAVKLLPPVATSITAVKGEAMLSAGGLAPVSVGVDVDTSVTTENGKAAIGFISKPFKLLGDAKSPLRQTFHVVMSDAAGKTYQQDFHLIYDPTQ